MTISEALKKYHKIEIDLLLSHVLGKSREFLYMNPGFILTFKHLNILTSLIKRREKGEPIAYILGYKDFYGLRFKVNKNVLIPRPETEEIVDAVIASASEAIYLRDRHVGRPKPRPPRDDRPIKILDVGTGSGNIIVSLAKCLGSRMEGLGTKCKFFASDVSQAALKVAEENAKKHRVKIKFIHTNILENVRMKFDVLIANLPYVPAAVYKLKIKDLRYEPKSALTDGTNKFILYEKFFQQVPKFLNPKSVIYLEIDPRAKMALINWQKKYLPDRQIKFYKDLNNLWRYAEIL